MTFRIVFYGLANIDILSKLSTSGGATKNIE